MNILVFFICHIKTMINIIEYAIYRDFFHRIFQAMFFFKTKSPQCGEKNKHGNDIADRKHTTVCNQFLCRTEQLYIGWFIWEKAKISKNHVYLPGRYYRIHRSCPYINGIAALAGTKLQTFKNSCEITYVRNLKDIYTVYHHTEAEQLSSPNSKDEAKGCGKQWEESGHLQLAFVGQALGCFD